MCDSPESDGKHMNELYRRRQFVAFQLTENMLHTHKWVIVVKLIYNCRTFVLPIYNTGLQSTNYTYSPS